MIALSERLTTIANLIPDGAMVCDVGTDHGYLPIYLAERGTVKSIAATDIHEKPLQAARKNLSDAGVFSVSLFLCDGLAAVSRQTVDTVVVAGMGGEVIAGILAAAEWLRDETVLLLLQPTTSAEILRDFLAENGFETEREPAVFENGKVYSVMQVRYRGTAYGQSPAERYAGKVSPQTAAGRHYIEKQLRRCSDCAKALQNRPEKAAEFEYYAQAAKALSARLSEATNGI